MRASLSCFTDSAKYSPDKGFEQGPSSNIKMNRGDLPSSSSKASDNVRKPFCRALTCIVIVIMLHTQG